MCEVGCSLREMRGRLGLILIDKMRCLYSYLKGFYFRLRYFAMGRFRTKIFFFERKSLHVVGSGITIPQI